MNNEAELAIAQVKQAGLSKKINADSWNNEYEDIISEWGEKASGLRYMHNNQVAFDSLLCMDHRNKYPGKPHLFYAEIYNQL